MGVPSTCSTVAVIGNGIIGHGVAQIFAMAGKSVVMIGRSDQSLAAARDRIRRSLEDFAVHELIGRGEVPDILSRIKSSTHLSDAAPANLIVEAVTEDLALKRDIFGQLDRICPPPAVLASSSGQPASATGKTRPSAAPTACVRAVAWSWHGPSWRQATMPSGRTSTAESPASR